MILQEGDNLDVRFDDLMQQCPPASRGSLRLPFRQLLTRPAHLASLQAGAAPVKMRERKPLRRCGPFFVDKTTPQRN